MRIGFHSIKVHNVLTEIRYDSTETNKIRYYRIAFMLSRVRGERVMADMVQDNLCCSRSVVDWPKVTRSLLGAVSFLVIGLLVLYGMLKQGIHDIFPYFFIAIGIVNLLLFRVNANGTSSTQKTVCWSFRAAASKSKTGRRTSTPLSVSGIHEAQNSSRRDTRNPPASKHEANGLRQWPFACERTKQDRTQRRFWRRFAFIPIKGKTG